eukprot:gnl/Dysnectes_brevis/311_a345_4684.p2 GENE.gnl/Dysnectes_brevis/311_a345_4684~~gnl/Dysnectes_brevis/311_a345_4684.p2  ORF type:complete len:174 (+),score=83.33 gnl/Dysnectes_brevis/311_a345_4684:443-964(+)
MEARIKSKIIEIVQNEGYTQQDFYNNRPMVQQTLLDQLRDTIVIEETGEPYGTIEMLQLRRIEFPNLVDSELVDLQIAVVGEDIAGVQGDIDTVEADTALLTVQNEALIQEINAIATRNITKITGELYKEIADLQSTTYSEGIDTLVAAGLAADDALSYLRMIDVSDITAVNV